jgi:hypothetical protein
MKAITKAKRRVTLSISGLGLLDETEIPEPVQHRAPTAAAKGINEAQRARLLHLAEELDADIPQYLEYLSVRWEFDVGKLADIPVSHFDDALAQLERKREQDQKRLGEEAERIQQQRAVKHDPITGEVADAS